MEDYTGWAGDVTVLSRSLGRPSRARGCRATFRFRSASISRGPWRNQYAQMKADSTKPLRATQAGEGPRCRGSWPPAVVPTGSRLTCSGRRRPIRRLVRPGRRRQGRMTAARLGKMPATLVCAGGAPGLISPLTGLGGEEGQEKKLSPKGWWPSRWRPLSRSVITRGCRPVSLTQPLESRSSWSRRISSTGGEVRGWA